MSQFLPPAAVHDRITQIQAELPPTVRLIAVTKTVPTALMRVAYAAGVRDFGESRLQEAIAKQTELKELADITWHLIGHLQSNKAAKAMQHFHWIHAIDSLKLAQQLDHIAQQQGYSPKLCLQVKFRTDPAKYGWSLPDLQADLPSLDRCSHLQIRGIMTILPQELTEPEIAQTFQQAQAFTADLQQRSWSHLQFQELSMGMSGDYRWAIAAGATMIRLGQILFGARTP
ncbi:YggS family pyridoxal phosphate-dependent enzyme [Trichothermofontia sp.]